MWCDKFVIVDIIVYYFERIIIDKKKKKITIRVAIVISQNGE